MTLCFWSKYSIMNYFEFGITVINNTKRTELQAYLCSEFWDTLVLWQGQLSNDKLKLQSGDKVEVIFSRKSGHHIQPQTRSGNLSVFFQSQGSAVNDRGDQIADPMEEDFLTRLSQSHHWKPQGPAVSDRGYQISDPMDEDLRTCLSLSIHHWKPQGPAVCDRGDQISDPMDEDPLTRLSLSLDYSSSTCSGNIQLDT
ncbi:hypothetical protein ACFXTH_026122 [Malus domestica]